MSDVTASSPTPFSAALPDEETELRALTNALQMREGFSLIFARCNQTDERKRLMEEIKQRLPGFNVQEILFREPIRHLLDELRFRLAEPPPDAIFVSGLEYSLPVAEEASRTPLVAALNASRNSFSRYLPCPLVLWVPDYVLNAIFHGAPDFFSVRSGVYYFAASPIHTANTARLLGMGQEWQANNLITEDKRERIRHIISLLADYRALPEPQRDYKTEIQLNIRLGSLYFFLGQWQEAENAYRDALALSERLGDLKGQAVSLSNIGNVFQSQEKWEAAREAYHKVLDFYTSLQDTAGQATVLNNLALLYFATKQWIEAESLLKRSLEYALDISDKHRQAQILGNLVTVYTQLGHGDEAEATVRQSLEIDQEMNDVNGEAQDYNAIGNILANRGEIPDAMSAYKLSRQLSHSTGDLILEGTVLNNMATLYAAQGDLEAAITSGQQSVAILENVEETALLRQVKLMVAAWEAEKIATNLSN